MTTLLLRPIAVAALAALGAAAPAAAQTAMSAAPDKAAVEKALRAAHAKYATLQEGKNADYIPALAEGALEPLRHRARRRPTGRSTRSATRTRCSRSSRSPRCSPWRA